MRFREIAAFDVVHAKLEWPWIAFAASGDCLAYASSAKTIATRGLEGERVVEGTSFTLPPDLELDSGLSASEEAGARRAGLTKFSLAKGGALLAVAGIAGDASVVATLDASGERKRVRNDVLLGAGHDVQAIAFDRTGRRLWISAESATETVIALVDVASLEVVGVLRSAPFPRPALHELHVHPKDDAILLLAACGDEGSFARVAGFAGDAVSAVPSALDSGGIAAGFVGFSADAMRVHLAEADELRTHGWPTLDELSSVQFADDFVSSFSGAVLGYDILVDGEDAETGDDVVMRFDVSAIRGTLLPKPAPSGMWAGRLGPDAIVTIQAKGDPVRALVLRRAK
ncbi:MAG: hypothetical protein BGO98_13900 [Myxococcales bacterium 68-20]|nr:hypothetical protein [Myxococcales bacterium]OJY21064.1 MAG: hypothetical protein BGO98_13900 [Myxococcales bacterium 68-20]